ncbi:hypothetical protein, partial [Paracoccus haematequi]|uniref:hypothetical protein n=1 Tax=Paracoccus haematequi TaxID=2491866 RepID=UPI0019CFA15F
SPCAAARLMKVSAPSLLSPQPSSDSGERQHTLVRCNIFLCLGRLFDETGDELAGNAALSLIERKPDDKNAGKLRRQWC